ncbi:MAG: hypothetical protein HQL64_08510 [Magnetococcales bacterium]|nr:hypothetical protein [Magnetococcales bacterium]
MLWELTFLLNLLILYALIRWRGLLTCEGLGMAMVALVFVSDGVSLHIMALFGRDAGLEKELRILPNLVHFIGLLAFSGGLFIVDPTSRRLTYNVNLDNNPSVRHTIVSVSYFLVVMGIGMKLYAMFAWGFTSLNDYFSGMYMYQATKEGGGFMDSGMEIALLGLSLLVAIHGGSRFKQLFVIFVMLMVSMVFSFSKSGIHFLVILLAVALYYFNQDLMRSYIKFRYVILVIILLIVSMGLKTQLKYGQGAEVNLGASEMLTSSMLTFGGRYSSFGLYQGYSYLVNRMSENPSLFFENKVVLHTLTGWIPRFVWSDKPSHPFHARGDLVNEFYRIDQYGNDAPTLVGMAFADAGLQSVIIYLFVGGLILGGIRRIIVSSERYRFLSILWYVFFTVMFGPSISESGLLNLTYVVVFATILIITVFLFLGVRNMFRDSLAGEAIAPGFHGIDPPPLPLQSGQAAVSSD